MTMVERVARAMCACDGLDWDAQKSFETSASGADDEHEGYLERARAAIEAMREPTLPMLSAANRNNHPRDEETWMTMIDAALAEESKT